MLTAIVSKLDTLGTKRNKPGSTHANLFVTKCNYIKINLTLIIPFDFNGHRRRSSPILSDLIVRQDFSAMPTKTFMYHRVPFYGELSRRRW